MTEKLETYKCPHCIDEELARVMGALLVCRNCDLILTEQSMPFISQPQEQTESN